jgi:anti-sigma regulatory factor (Ser/Thr protein kinase)
MSCIGDTMRWRRVFPGAEVQIRELRRWSAELLPTCTARDDVIAVAVELAANAVRHTASGQPGGYFVAELTWCGPVVRTAVADGGGPSEPRVVAQPSGGELDGLAEQGRGLAMVEALSTRTGVIGDARGRVVWAETRWPAEHAPPAAVFEQVHQNMIATAEHLLHDRFGEFLFWYGRETHQWWACPKNASGTSKGLVSAPSAADLAEALIRSRRSRPAASRRGRLPPS